MNTTPVMVKPNDLLYQAIRVIAYACDGTKTLDGAGFNKFDATFGHTIAATPPEKWNDRQSRSAWSMLRKYRRQLSAAGIDYDRIPEPRIETEWRPSGVAATASRQIDLSMDKFIIRFAYDSRLVVAVKQIPGSAWDWNSKQWTVPRFPSNAEALRDFVRLHGFKCSDGVRMVMEELAASAATAKMNVEASRAADSDFEVQGLGGVLRAFQRAGVAYATKAERCFIADEMGLGKTVQALACIQHWQSFPAVIICPASLKLNWAREAYKWIPNRSVKVWSSSTGWPNEINIINYDILSKRLDELAALNPQAIIMDESHKLKNQHAKRTMATAALAEPIRYRLALTGTPILNRPNEIVAQLRILGRLEQLGGERSFPKRIGQRRLQELNHRLRASCYIRRNKIDVLKELPAKQRSTVPVAISNREEYAHAESQLIAWLKDQAMRDTAFNDELALLSDEEQLAARHAHAEEAAEKAKRAEQLVRINALKKLAARGKLESVTSWIEDFLESGEKLVLFAHHVEIVQEFGRRFNAPTITGQTDLKARQAAVDLFQGDPECKVIALNLEAGGVGLTLTAASNVAFIEQGWTPGLHDQAEDRCHRIGQQSQVNAWYLLAEKTIDMEIQELIDKKRVVVTAATDGTISKATGGILNDLVQRLKGRE